jgi:hypothetical protein
MVEVVGVVAVREGEIRSVDLHSNSGYRCAATHTKATREGGQTLKNRGSSESGGCLL